MEENEKRGLQPNLAEHHAWVMEQVAIEMAKPPSDEHKHVARNFNIQRIRAVKFEKDQLEDLRNNFMKEGRKARLKKKDFIKAAAELSIITVPLEKKIALLKKPISPRSIQLLSQSKEDFKEGLWMADGSANSFREWTNAEEAYDTVILTETSNMRAEVTRKSMSIIEGKYNTPEQKAYAAFQMGAVELAVQKAEEEAGLFSRSKSAVRLENNIRQGAAMMAEMVGKTAPSLFAGMEQSGETAERDGDGPAFAYRVGMDFTEAALKECAQLASNIRAKGGNMTEDLTNKYVSAMVVDVLDSTGASLKIKGMKEAVMKGVAQELALDPVIGKDKKRMNKILNDIAKDVFAKKSVRESMDALSDDELAAKGYVRIPGYTKKDGTKVKHHYRKLDPADKGVKGDRL
jgi:hypothetical protein